MVGAEHHRGHRGGAARRAGKTVALLDSKRIVQGATGYTGEGDGGPRRELLEDPQGLRRRQRAGLCRGERGAQRVAQFVDEDGIDCDFERKANYVYAESEEEVAQLRQEAEVERKAGLGVNLVDETPLPFSVSAALRLDNQAQFHPRKYLLALAATIPGDGSHVFENSRVHGVKHGEPCEVSTEGGTLRAGDVVLATHLPILDSGLFFTKAYPHQSYAVAAPIGQAPDPDGMYISSGTPTRSIRTLRNGDRLFIQVGGNGHKVGEEDTPSRYDQLDGFLRRHWPDAGQIRYRWSTEDYMTHDYVPYVGRLRRGSSTCMPRPVTASGA